MRASPTLEQLARRFPAIRRVALATRRRRRVPVVQQMTTTECGPACIAMVLGYYGKVVALEQLRAVMGVGRDGATVQSMVNAAHHFGLRGRALKLELEELACLQPGAVLHWEFRHFVVLERHRGDAIDIVDPSNGRRRVPLAEVGRAFTGIALVFEPSESFRPARDGERRSMWREIARKVIDSGHWRQILVISLMAQLMALAVPIFTSTIVDQVVPRGDAHLLLVLGVGMATLVVFYFLSQLLRTHLMFHLQIALDVRMTMGFLDHLLRLPYHCFQQRQTGDLLGRVNSNAAIRDILTSGLLSALLDAALVSLYLVVIFVADLRFGLLVTTLLLLRFVVFWLTRKRQSELGAEVLDRQARSESHLTEILNGIETFKATGREDYAGQKWAAMFVDQVNVAIERSRLIAILDSSTNMLQMASPLVILGFGAWKVLGGGMSLGELLGLSALAGGCLGPVNSLVAAATQCQMLGSYLARMEDILAIAPEQPDGATYIVPQLRGTVTLDRVSFAYSPLSRVVLKDVSVEIAAGQFVAIVGSSGSGKTTLASLLLGLYLPTAGRIEYDGVELRQLALRSLRQQIGLVNQRAYLFGGAIRANIAMSDDEVSLDEIIEAAKLACIHDEIVAMPMGYDTLITDGGASLSGGQRQRIALARALVRRPAILLLDEATSALDAMLERRVQENLARQSCTRIVIAHRLSTIRDADVILVVEGGAVIERGTHHELLEKSGVYARLVAAQLEEQPRAATTPIGVPTIVGESA